MRETYEYRISWMGARFECVRYILATNMAEARNFTADSIVQGTDIRVEATGRYMRDGRMGG